MKLLILLLAPFLCIGQEYKKGTIIIGVIAKDGVIIAADSRIVNATTNSDGTKSVTAYCDSCQKIFNINGTAIAMGGIYELDGTPFYKIVEQFNNYMANGGYNSSQTISKFMGAIQNSFPTDKYPQIINNQFISGFYRNDSAIFVVFKYIDGVLVGEGHSKPNIYMTDSNAVTIFNKYYTNKSKIYSSKKVANRMEKTINEYAKCCRVTIGIPVQIIKINRDNSIVFLKNDFSKNPLGENEKHLIPIGDTSRFNREFRGDKN